MRVLRQGRNLIFDLPNGEDAVAPRGVCSTRGFVLSTGGSRTSVSPVAVVIIGTILLALALAALLPGIGFIASIIVVLIGISVVAWLLVAARSGQRPSEVASQGPAHEFLGPGGPDDPRGS